MSNVYKDTGVMFTWILGLPLLGSLIQILTPAAKGVMEGIVAWCKALWHGIKTSNYGTWTLILTVAASIWLWKQCPSTKCTVKAPTAKSTTIGKTSTATNPRDTFFDGFRLW